MTSKRRQKVNLTRHKVKGHIYWCLRWFGSDGKHHGTSIGRADGPEKISRRHAEIKRSEKEQELDLHPARRDVCRSFTLGRFLEGYLASRKHELAPGTFELHSHTARYLEAFFGSNHQIDRIKRPDARAFKTALARGDLMKVSKRGCILKPATVERIIREARTIFNRLVEDDQILGNPFSRLSRKVTIEKAWYYVDCEEYNRLAIAAPDINWRLLISLCRLAALRRGEALNLRWEEINWHEKTLRVIAKENWRPKDKKPRIVPICPELEKLLLDGYHAAKSGQELVIKRKSLNNLRRDFYARICRPAGVPEYSKPFHTLRKNCVTDWAMKFPAHVVQEWAGHSDLNTTNEFYLQVSGEEYKRASETGFFDGRQGFLTKPLAKPEEKKGLDNNEDNRIIIADKEI